MNDEDWLKKRNYKRGVGCVTFMLILALTVIITATIAAILIILFTTSSRSPRRAPSR